MAETGNLPQSNEAIDDDVCYVLTSQASTQHVLCIHGVDGVSIISGLVLNAALDCTSFENIDTSSSLG